MSRRDESKVCKCPTYSSPSFIAPWSVDALSQFPCIVVSERSEDRLSHFGRGYQEVGAVGGRKSKDPGEAERNPVDNSKYRWVDGRSKVGFPFLHATSAIVLFLSSNVYPSDPGSTIGSKTDLPRRLQRLKELIGLEEGLDAQRIQNPKCDEK